MKKTKEKMIKITHNADIILQEITNDLVDKHLENVLEHIIWISYRMGKVFLYTRNPGKVIGPKGINMNCIENTIQEKFGINPNNVKIVKIELMNKYVVTEQLKKQA